MIRQSIFKKPENSISRKRVMLFILPLLAVFITGVASIMVSGQTVGYGTRIRALEKEYMQLVDKEKTLEQHIAQKQSLQKLKEEAIREGYIPVLRVQYVGLVTPVASR